MKLYYLFGLLFNVLFINAQMVFSEEPKEFKPKLEVASCYVIYKEKILFLKRCATSTWNFTWGIPGGKIEKHQSPYDAMIQEALEETGLDISKMNPRFLKKLYVKDPQKDFIYHVFICELHDEPKAIILAPNEHTEYKWLTAAQALKELELVPGEDECLRFIF